MRNRNAIEKGRFLLLTLAACFFVTCTNNDEPIENNPNNETPKEYIVSLGFSGEITDITESPLSRAVTNDLYGIQVYSTPAATNEEYAPYAYGLFDDKNNMVIKLLEGYKYKFVVSMIVDGKNVINSSIEEKYFLPFNLTPICSNFEYSNQEQLPSLDYGETWMKNSDTYYDRAMIERFYGEISDYEPIENGTISIEMKRVSFGAKFIAENFTEGTLNIQLEEAPLLVMKYPATTIEEIFTFSNGYGNGDAWTADDYSETIPISITWTKNDGAVVPLVTQNITFKRNKLTTITIKINDAGIENGVNISTENEEIQPGDNIVIDTNGSGDSSIDPTI